MSLTRLFVRRPTLAFVLIAVVSLAGVLAWTTLVQQQFPNVSQPTISVSVSYPGASTTEMRDAIILPIEDKLAGTPDLDHINSTIQSGQATISAVFALSSDVNTDLVNVQKAVQNAQKQLPSDLTAPTVSNRDPSESVVVTLAVSSKSLDDEQLSLIVNGRIVPAIEQIPGVSNVNAAGLITPAYEVQVNPSSLASAGLTLNDVTSTLASNNVRAPGGIAYQPDRETQIDVRADIQSPQQVAELPITASGASGSSSQSATASSGPAESRISAGALNPWTVAPRIERIGDVATVADVGEPRRVFADVNGKHSMFLQVQKASDASEVTASKAVLADLPKLRAQFPQVQFDIVNVQSKYTEQQIDGVIRTLLEGIAFVAIAMVFFLRSWRNAVVVLIAIPTSLCIALFAMKMLNLTLDTVSLLGMTLVIGILVDDSTVVIENVDRHHEHGEPPKLAAVNGRSEIGMAAIVITLVDVVVFLPIAFMGGQVGHQLSEFGVVVTVSTLTSLFVSFTITPALAGLWALRSKWKAPKIVDWFTSGFESLRNWYAHRALIWGLNHRWPVVLVAALLVVGALALVPTGMVGETFIPPQDRGEIFVQFTYPTGTPVAQASQGVFAVEHAVIKQVPDLQADTAVAGAYAASFGGFVQEGNVGQVHLFLKTDRKKSTNYWVGYVRKLAKQIAPRAQIVAVPSTGTGGGNAQPIDELVSLVDGGDPTQAAAKVTQILASTPGAVNVNNSASDDTPQVEVVFNRAAARALNVSIGTAATAIRSAFGGTLATEIETNDGLIEVQVIYPLADQHSLENILAIPIRSTTGEIVHVGDVASLQYSPAPLLITRENRATVVHVNANVAPNASLSNVTKAFQQRLKAAHLGRNVVVHPAALGQQDLMNQTLLGLGASLILSSVLVYLLMVALYNSFIEPFIIMFAVPVATVGALGALFITHQTLNLFSLIGTILLVGLVTKNGILLVDYANRLRDRGEDKLTAIKESAATRFRPIIMTTAAMVVGMTPLALALEPGSSVRASLGIVVIGGLISSLILTLVIVPIMYVWLAPAHGAPSDDELDATSSDGKRGRRSPAETLGAEEQPRDGATDAPPRTPVPA